MKYYRYGHVERIKVKVGDRIKKGQLIAENGTGNGQWYAHCHADCLTYKPAVWTEFCIGKSKDWVKKHYADIRGLEKVIMPTYDHLGYGWLEDAQYAGGHAFHPGLDLNGKGSGNADLDDPIHSACDGVVVYVYSGTGRNYGWGDCIVIQEVNETPKLVDIEDKEVNKPQAPVSVQELEKASTPTPEPKPQPEATSAATEPSNVTTTSPQPIQEKTSTEIVENNNLFQTKWQENLKKFLQEIAKLWKKTQS